MRLEIDNAAVGYDGRVVLSGASLELADGQIGCLIGPSGAGKTTLLRAVAGFEARTFRRKNARWAWCSRITPCCPTSA